MRLYKSQDTMLDPKKIAHKTLEIPNQLIKEDAFDYIEYRSSEPNAKTFFLISPTADGAAFWSPFLRHSDPKYNYVAVGLPGFENGSRINQNLYSVSELSAFYEDFINSLDLDKLVIMGMSITVPVSHELALSLEDRVDTVILMGGGEFFPRLIRISLIPFVYLMAINRSIRNFLFSIVELFIPMLRRYDKNKLRASIQHIYMVLRYRIPSEKASPKALLLRGALDTVVSKGSFTKFKSVYKKHIEKEFKYNHKISDDNVEKAIRKTMPMIFDILDNF